MSKKALLLALFVIIVLFSLIAWKGFVLLKAPTSPQPVPVNNIPDNLAISEEQGG